MESGIFSKIYYHTKFKDPSLSYFNPSPTQEVCAAIMFVVLIVENYKVIGRGSRRGIYSLPSFMKFLQLVQKLLVMTDART
jgi:hypothetical protein